MYKLTDSTKFDGELNIFAITTEYYKGLQKTAANTQVAQYISELLPKVKPDKAYFHINAMGAGEYYGANRNGDYFPEEQLLKYYETFVTSPAHLFRHHINKDPSIANGKVIFANYNSTMHRVELIAEADKSLVQDIEQRIAQGDYPSTSMACKTPYDVCSICGNMAHSRAEYCVHLKNDLGKVYEDGRKVMAINAGPLSFFDISVVLRGADPTSYILTKVAGDETALGSAERAELEKVGSLGKMTKLSELVKDIDGGVVTSVDLPVNPLPIEVLVGLASDSWENITRSMAKEGILPSLQELASLYYLKHGMVPDIELINKLIKINTSVPAIELDKEEIGSGAASGLAKKASAICSMSYKHLEKRALDGGGFYINTPQGYFPDTSYEQESKGPGMASRVLFAISALGAAVAAYRMVYNSLADNQEHPFLRKVAGIKLAKELSM